MVGCCLGVSRAGQASVKLHGKCSGEKLGSDEDYDLWRKGPWVPSPQEGNLPYL